MARIKGTIPRIFKRTFSVFLALALFAGLVPAFAPLGASAAPNDHYDNAALENSLREGQQVTLHYELENGVKLKDSFLSDTNGTKLNIARTDHYTADFGNGAVVSSMPYYCIEKGEAYVTPNTVVTLHAYNNPRVAAAFANGYNCIPYWYFRVKVEAAEASGESYMDYIFPDGNVSTRWLTEAEYSYATQVAIWAALGQVGVEGATSARFESAGYPAQSWMNFNTGTKGTIKAPDPSDQAAYRVYSAILVILQHAVWWIAGNDAFMSEPSKVYVKADSNSFNNAVYVDGVVNSPSRYLT